MAKSTVKAPYKSLKSVAVAHGTDVKDLIISAIATHGSMRAAADALGISHTSIQWWMARNNYRVKFTAQVVPASEVEAVQS